MTDIATPIPTSPVIGIDHLKSGLKTVSDFRNQVAQTKRFNILALLGFVDDLAAIGETITAWKDIIAEAKDLDSNESKELATYALEVLKIPATKVAKFVSDALQWLITTIDLVEQARHLKDPA